MAAAKLKKLNNYNLGVIFSTLVGAALIAFLISAGFFWELPWYVDSLIALGLLGGVVSGTSYFTRFIDWLTARKKASSQQQVCRTLISDEAPTSKPSLLEKIATGLGILFGVGITIALIATRFVVPFVKPLGLVLSYAIFGLRNIAIFAGLAHRAASPTAHRPRNEKIIIISALLIGLVSATTLLLTGASSILGTISVTALFSVGVGFCPPLAIGIFILTYVSAWGSAAEYFSRAVNFVRFLCGNEGVKAEVSKRKFEYGGALVGIVAGIIIGITVAALVATPPIGLALALASTLIIVSCGILGGLCGRLGRAIDGYRQAPIEQASPPPTGEFKSTFAKVNEKTVGSAAPALIFENDNESDDEPRDTTPFLPEEVENRIEPALDADTIFDVPLPNFS